MPTKIKYYTTKNQYDLDTSKYMKLKEFKENINYPHFTVSIYVSLQYCILI